MKLLDISRELTRAPVYPGDPEPSLRPLSRLSLGDPCNLSAMDMCLHNGTHLDAPLHFVPDGADAAQTPLDVCVGECYVIPFDGVLLGAQAEEITDRLHPERLLFKGEMEISPSAAFVLSDAGVKLVGVEAPSIAPSESVAAVHRQLLGRGVHLLEGLDLSSVQEGYYFLFAVPLKIAGADGAPVRAVLLERTLGL
ncbi:MAG: hypothetical protein HFJ79_04660 [Clostridiales bacterium]|nr:hypothetical protein [Clostridiales bacterium]